MCVRKPEATTINRITAFNKEVQLFYRLLGDLIDKYRFINNIYNCDATRTFDTNFDEIRAMETEKKDTDKNGYRRRHK